MGIPMIIAHRGGRLLAPENTMSAIRFCMDNNVKAIEFDVRFTKDNIPVLIHDDNLKRMTSEAHKGYIDSYTYDELCSFDVGFTFSDKFKGEMVPTLEEAVKAISSSMMMFIEIKDNKPMLCPIIINILRKNTCALSYKILSFHKEVLEKIKELDSTIETVYLFYKTPPDAHQLLRNSNFDHFGVNVKLVSHNHTLICKLLDANREVYSYSVNEKADIILLQKLNITGLITDDPIHTKKVITSPE